MPPEPKRNSHLAMLGAAHSLNHSLFVITPPLLTLIMNDLNVTKLTIGTIAFVASLLYGVGALVGGPLGDRIGEVRTIAICLGFSGLSTFIMLAAGVTGSVYFYAFALIVMATWASLYHPAANALISRAFGGGVGEAMGLHGVGGTLGVVLTPVVSWLIGSTFGWPWAFATFGLLSLSFALLFIRRFAVTRNPRRNGGTIIDALRIRELWILLIFNVMIGLFMKGVELYFPTFLQEERLIDPAWASVAYMLVLAAGVPGQWIGGKTADKVGSKKVLIATSAGVFASLAALLWTPFAIVGIALFIVFYGLSFYGHQPALNSLTGLLSPSNQRGAVFGVFFFTSFGVGSISQFIAGYVADLYSLTEAFYLLAAFALIALLLSFLIPSKRAK